MPKNEQETKIEEKKISKMPRKMQKIEEETKEMNKILLDQVCGFWVPLISACKHLWAHSTYKLLKNLVGDMMFVQAG